jgi:large subunit ribosomal protein L25
VAFEIQGEAREGGGRTASRRLRRLGRVPAVVYGGGKDPSSISVDHNAIAHDMTSEAFYTSILTLNVGSEKQSVVVKDVQRHPARTEIMHLDFQRVVEDEEITLNVPIHLTGEDAARGVKEQGGEIEHLMADVEISCLPRDLPEFLELDVTDLGLNEILHLSDIKFPDGVTCTPLAHELDHPVVSIHPPRRQEVDEEVVEGAELEAAPEAAAAEEQPEAEEPTED